MIYSSGGRRALFLAAGALWAGPLAAAGKTGFGFLSDPPVAAVAGMAGAATTLSGDPSALYVNPAGLARLREESVSLHSQSQWQDLWHEAFSFVGPARGGGWGVAAGVVSVEGLIKTRYDPTSPDRYVTEGTLRAGDQYVSAAVGRRWASDLSWGAGAKVVREELGARSAVTVAVDAGLLRRMDAQWRAAAVVRDAGVPGRFSSKQVRPPARLEGGLSLAPSENAEWELGGVLPLQGDAEARLGGRFSWEEKFFMRLGYRFRLKKNGLGAWSGASAGLGGRWGAFGADYAFQPFGDLGAAHRLTLTWRTGGRPPRRTTGPRSY